MGTGYRKEENCLPGFNLVVIDVDEGTSIATAKLLLKEYKYLLYTTKRSTDKINRFRIVFPISHILKLSASDFKTFMNNIYDWLPFEVDRQTNQRSRKWLTNQGKYFYNDGDLLNALLFIPKTSKAKLQKEHYESLQSLSNAERWFVKNTDAGNRSNQLIRYALMLVDAGMDIDNIRNNVLALNSKLPKPLDEAEVLRTIIVSASKSIHRRDIA